MIDENLDESEIVESALDKPPVNRMSVEDVLQIQQMLHEHNANPIEYKFLWKNSLVLCWVAGVGITCERREGLTKIDVRERYPDLPNVNSVKELSALAHRLGWKRADQIQGLDLDTCF